MKKLTPFFLVLSLFAFSSFGFATSTLDSAISWMNQNGLTKFTNAQDFMSSGNLRRDEATKFFVQYAKTVLKSVPDESKTDCNKFLDLKEGWSDLADTMKDACKLGLFNGANGKFMPTQNLTNAQALTVLIRMIDGKKDESQGHFAQKYFEKAQEFGIMKGLTLDSTDNFDKLTTRGDVAVLLYNASNLETKNNTGNIIVPKKTNTTSTTINCSSADSILACTMNTSDCPAVCKTTTTNTTVTKNNKTIDTTINGVESVFVKLPINLRGNGQGQLTKSERFYLKEGKYKVSLQSSSDYFIAHLIDKDDIIVKYLASERGIGKWVKGFEIYDEGWYRLDIDTNGAWWADISARS